MVTVVSQLKSKNKISVKIKLIIIIHTSKNMIVQYYFASDTQNTMKAGDQKSYMGMMLKAESLK